MKAVEKTNDTVTRREQPVLVPVSDIYQTADEYILKMELPGLSKEDLEITIEGEELEVRGIITPYQPEDKERRLGEFGLYNYYRRFTIGNDIDRDRIEAALDGGVLTLTLHKTEEVKPRSIKIEAH